MVLVASLRAGAAALVARHLPCPCVPFGSPKGTYLESLARGVW